MNISLTPELDRFVASKVETGDYATASEVVRDALRALKAEDETRQVKLELLRSEIQRGIDSSVLTKDEAYKNLSHRIGTEVNSRL